MTVEKKYFTINEINGDNYSSIEVVSDFRYGQTHLPPIIFTMTRLRRLEAKFGELVEIPDEIQDLHNLQELFLQSNKIERVSFKIGQLAKLKKLRLFDNKISDFTPICLISNLIELEIGRNQIKSIPDEIGNLKKLKKLDLGNLFYSNEIEHVSTQIGLLQNLEFLSFHGARLGRINESIGELVMLRNLSIRNSHVNSISFDFDKLQNLEILDFTNNKISRVPENLSRALNLTSVYFDNNPINEIPESVLNLPKIKVFGISRTQIDIETIENYKKRFPNKKFLTDHSYFSEIHGNNA